MLRSRLAGLPGPIDGVTTSLDNSALVERDARLAADLGFSGKLAIHPRQIAPILRAFLPDESALAWAARVLLAGQAGGAIQVDGEMVDLPLLARARRILARAAAK